MPAAIGHTWHPCFLTSGGIRKAREPRKAKFTGAELGSLQMKAGPLVSFA